MESIKYLELFYSSLTINEIKVTDYAFISDLKLFSSSHLATVKHNINKETHKPYLNRLIYVKKLIENEQN